jgi:hypothetical protein
MSKKYLTSEAIAMLEKNPSAKFTTKILKDTCEMRADHQGYILTHFSGKLEGFEGNVQIDTEWELIQQSIPFMEAVKAYSEGKPVDCEICGKVWHYNPNSIPKDSSLGYHLVVTNKCGTSPSITTEEILRGKWTIAEDSNE